MNSYNLTLRNLREAKGLSIKEASKEIGISALGLYFYEEGYFKPTKKAKKKIEEYYQTTLEIDGMASYPTPTHPEHETKMDKKKLLRRRIIFGALSLLMASFVVTGGVLFSRSTNNIDPYYGDTYIALRTNVEIRGTLGHDLVTGLEYYQVERSTSDQQASVIFYSTDNLLYFNEVSYSCNDVDGSFGIGRYHFLFGGPLGQHSNICNFTYGSLTTGTYFQCNFVYNNEPVTKVENFVVRVQGHQEVNEELAVNFINKKLANMESFISNTLFYEILSREVSFYNDFLPAREQGRVINYMLQIVGLSFIIPGIILFFLFFGIFTRLMILNIKPRLVGTTGLVDEDEHKPLPKDINMKIGIPDFIVLAVARTVTVLSILLMILGFIGSLGILKLPSFFSHPTYLSSLRISLLTGIFLTHFVVLGRHKRPDDLLKKIIYNLYLFLFLATMETAIIGITNAWGYDFASLIYQYLPGNIFQVIAVQYIIYLFLFFQPPFLNKEKKLIRYGWHALSLIPLGFLIASYFISNSYMLVYGVKENLYINFWFPNGFLPLSIVSTLFMYTTFVLSLLREKKYGIRNSQIYSYGDRHALIENLVCVGFIILVGLFDLLFIHNQYGYYLGLGYNQWIFTIIPFIILVKYSPNKKQLVLLGDEISKMSRELA